jgi:hypothetical protein
MVQISIFNYEAFYLDFLEGNLNEEETALFLNFMKEHPELHLEDTSLFAMDNEFITLDQSFKENLKQLNFNETRISLNNVEQFLIAQIEGLLSENKNAELDNFIAKDVALLTAQRQYEHTKMTADLSICYLDKSSLKQARRIALWPILSFATAASVALFFFLENPVDQFGQTAGTIAKMHMNAIKTPFRMHNANAVSKTNLTRNKQSVFTTEQIVNQPRLVSTNSVFAANEPIQLNVKQVKRLPIRETENDIQEQTFAHVINASPVAAITSNYGFQDMKNPIKPITNRLSDVVKQEVDFRTAKATEKTPGGFYLKIGKLEISHKTN